MACGWSGGLGIGCICAIAMPAENATAAKLVIASVERSAQVVVGPDSAPQARLTTDTGKQLFPVSGETPAPL